MNIPTRYSKSLPMAAFGLLVLVACGGIEGTGSPIAGIEGTGVSDGGASGFGSVYVNGIEYNTDHASILVNGGPDSEEALQVGMILRVHGNVAQDGVTGVADRVEFDRPLYGPIEDIDHDTRVLTVLGQPVHLDDATLYGTGSESALAVGQLCMVSAYPETNGSWFASLVNCSGDYIAGQTVVEVEGLARNVDVGTGQLNIGNLQVRFDGAALDASEGALAEGVLVDVTGRQPQSAGVLEADTLRVKSVQLEPGTPVQMEGIIGRFTALDNFELSRQLVDASDAQREDSLNISPASGVRMRLQGVVSENGTITASRFHLQPVPDVLMTGRLDRVDRDRSRVTVFGGEHKALDVTQYEDNSTQRRRRFRLRDLREGDYVQMRGFRDAQGHTVVTRIERRNEEEPNSGTVVARFRVGLGNPDPLLAQVRGLLDSFSFVDSRLVIAGVQVATDNSRTEFMDRSGNSVTSLQFYNDLKDGDRLYAEGNESNDVIQATQVSHAR